MKKTGMNAGSINPVKGTVSPDGAPSRSLLIPRPLMTTDEAAQRRRGQLHLNSWSLGLSAEFRRYTPLPFARNTRAHGDPGATGFVCPLRVEET